MLCTTTSKTEWSSKLPRHVDAMAQDSEHIVDPALRREQHLKHSGDIKAMASI